MRTIVYQSTGLYVVDYRCEQGPNDAGQLETHAQHCLAYVRSGSFGCEVHGRQHELAAGSFFIGRQGDAYRCRHDHHRGGDVCLSFCFDPASADAFGKRNLLWRMGALPPIADCMVLGELACAAAGGEADVGLCEVAVLLASRLTHTAGGTREDLRISAADRRRAVRAALWLDARTADETVDLSGAAAQAHLSSYHFLRVFSRVFGVTPHQYLIRRRLARAARLLASEPLGVTQIGMMVGFNDVSHFVRSFRRHAGKTPSQFRALARGERRSLERAMQPPTS